MNTRSSNTRFGKRTLSPAAVLIIGALIGVTAVALWMAAASAGETLSLRGVDPARLQATGVTLSPPTGKATLSVAQARLTVRDRFPGGTIEDLRLVQYQDSHRNPPVNCLCWVASVSGYTRSLPGGQPGGPRMVLGGPVVVAIKAEDGSLVEWWQAQG